MGKPGATGEVIGANVSGVSDVSGSVTTNEEGVSVITATATVTNPVIKNFITNLPGVTFNGDVATVTDVKIKATNEGFESIKGFDPGIIVKYSSAVGDKYYTKSGNERTVTAVSTTNDYSWDGMNIKVIKVEENIQAKNGLSKVTYWANHKWGMVGLELKFTDGTIAKFPIVLDEHN
ncbi:MAG TPA: hypothetical protein GX005_06840 [Bacteroidales bacterium]|nr:hypothetical protein [Bacteroidales bacterium]